MKKVVALIVLVVLLDRGIGLGLEALHDRTRTGEQAGLLLTALETDADLLVLGSSRARHHVMPSELQRATGLRTYNAGLDGQDFLYSVLLYERLRLVRKPRVVLLHLDDFSLTGAPDEVRRLQQFARWVDDDAYVREVLTRRSAFEPIKLWSWTYRFNGIALPILRNALLRRGDVPGDGFVPLDGHIRPEGDAPKSAPASPAAPFRADPQRLADLRRFMDRCRADGVRLILFTTPTLLSTRSVRDAWQAALRAELEQRPDVTFLALDRFTAPEPYESLALYRDNGHLNREGAVHLSAWLGRELVAVLGPTRDAARGEPAVAAP